MQAVLVHGLSKSYGEVAALDAVSLAVERGEILAVLGPNGAGKTTLVEIIAGFRKADVGRVTVFGLDPLRDRKALTKRVGVMPQEGGVYPGLRVREALALFASYYEDPVDEGDLLALLGLERVSRRPYRRLSGGEKQRLSLALAIIGRPELAILDEPTAGMDPRARIGTWYMIERLQDDGTTVLLTTHYMDEAEKLADRIAIIDRGRVVALDTPGNLTTVAGAELRFTTRPGLDAEGLGHHLRAHVREGRPGEYTVEAPSSPSLVASLTAWLAERGVPLASLSAGKRSLEDVFLDLTNGEPE